MARGLQIKQEPRQYHHPERLFPGVVRVLANNPKDYTGPGTNSYLVGVDTLWVIDPGPDRPEHVDALLAALRGRPVAGILVTHSHLDHSAAARALQKHTGAQIYGYGPLGPEVCTNTEEDIDPDFNPDVQLVHGQCLGVADWQVKAIHTPGHFPNHLCYLLPAQGILFSGDHVLGHSTTAIIPPLGNLSDYMDSLDILYQQQAALLLPGHGPIVRNAKARIFEIRDHRLKRHSQIQGCLALGKKNPADIVQTIYGGEFLSPRLLKAAEGSVRAHLETIGHGTPKVLMSAE